MQLLQHYHAVQDGFIVAMARGLNWMAISGFTTSQLREELRRVDAEASR